MKPMDFGIKDADLVGMYDVEGAEYLIVEGFDREGVTTRFTMSVFVFDKLRAQYKSKREEFEAEVVRQSLDEPCPTDSLGVELPPEIH
tara:strand:+ start:66 stop:329 length:264 start_codon:yes stop_codon:yes gene_type:complete